MALSSSILPVGDAPKALRFPHFPTRHQAVVWRNWNLVAPERLAEVLGTTAEAVVACGEEMGLSRDDSCLERWAERGFITIIRRNWELLDYPQLLQLLGWSEEKLAFALKEDDFLFHKLGLGKPLCGEVRFRELTDEEAKRTAHIRRRVQRIYASLPPRREAPFAFLDHYGRVPDYPRDAELEHSFEDSFIYSYSALYGDALEDDGLASYPEALFADYAASGVGGVWLQGVLYRLVPWLGEDLPESVGWQRRLRNLQRLVDRAGRHGVKIYLYLNEPRSMPEKFFEAHPGMKGAAGLQDDFAICTSAPGVLEALSAGVERLSRAVPGLGGIFTITQSENLTHCLAQGGHCPRCGKRGAPELIAELLHAIKEGLRRAGGATCLIAFNWAWEGAWQEELVGKLDAGIDVMAVSENRLPAETLGFRSEVRDYSISRVGPGAESRLVWEQARRHGHQAIAKIQANASWELAALPYIPVPDLVEEHLAKLRKCGVRRLMLSWTLGGSPGGNLPLLKCSKEHLAEFLYGRENAPAVLAAWAVFSDSFAKYFPVNRFCVLYYAPQNFGPASLFHPQPTGRTAAMVGFPYDDIGYWRGTYYGEEGAMPEAVLQEAFEKLAAEWRRGVGMLKETLAECVDGRQKRNLEELVTIADACRCHFSSSANQVVFVRSRNAGAVADGAVRSDREEALRLLELMRRDSRIGYEASNHYFYTENDMLEKILNCDWLLQDR